MTSLSDLLKPWLIRAHYNKKKESRQYICMLQNNALEPTAVLL